MMKKIIIATMLLFLLTGIVCAEDIADKFKSPSDLHKVGADSFVDGKGHNVQIFNDSAEFQEIWFKNDTGYNVEPYNDTCYTGVDDENDCYLLEFVEHEGNKYLINSWSANGVNDAKIIQKNLEEFNKINNLKPLKIDEVLQ